MGAIFQSLGKTITAGVVLLIVLLIILVAMGAKVALGEHAWWLFAMRWLHVTAGVMWIGLLWYFYFGQAVILQKPFTSIGLGMWLGTIMWANVWFVIWPNQKKALGIVTVEAAEKAAAAKRAGMASRINTMLSIPMLYFMVAQ